MRNIVTLYINEVTLNKEMSKKNIQQNVQLNVNGGIINLKIDSECYVQSTESFCGASTTMISK